MPNPLFNLLRGNAGGNFQPFMKMMQQLQRFAANFQGDPKAEVEKLLQSGKMTQQQLDQLQMMAMQLKQAL